LLGVAGSIKGCGFEAAELRAKQLDHDAGVAHLTSQSFGGEFDDRLV
jgi:hypothetical protein